MPNHPDIRIKTFTHTIEIDSIIVRVTALKGFNEKSSAVGPPKAQKSACTTSTRNIAIILSSSILDCLGAFVIEDIILIIISVLFMTLFTLLLL